MQQGQREGSGQGAAGVGCVAMLVPGMIGAVLLAVTAQGWRKGQRAPEGSREPPRAPEGPREHPRAPEGTQGAPRAPEGTRGQAIATVSPQTSHRAREVIGVTPSLTHRVTDPSCLSPVVVGVSWHGGAQLDTRRQTPHPSMPPGGRRHVCDFRVVSRDVRLL